MSYFSWLRRVVGANIPLLLFFVFLALFSVSRIALECFVYLVLFPDAANEWVFEEDAFHTFVGSWIAIAAFYGVVRGWIFHPISDARYHAWLIRSPWEVGKPLPKGPIHPAWQDAVTLALFTLIVAVAVVFFDASGKWIAGPSLAMIAGLVISWTGINLLTQQKTGQAVLLLVPLAFLFPMKGVGLVGGLIGTVGVAYYGVWKLLGEMPAREPFDRRLPGKLAAPVNRRGMEWQKNAAVGWPYSYLLREPDDWRLSTVPALTYTAIALAWASAIILSGEGSDQRELAYIMPIFLTGIVALFRTVFDSAVTCPRFCLGHRFVNRWLLVPSHDRLLLSPLLIILGGVVPLLVGLYLDGLGKSENYSLAGAILSCGLVVYLFFTLGRPIAQAFYTGPHSIAPGLRNAQCFTQLAAPGD